ncbi:MAG: 6-phosphofructokinase [Candidatus Brocadiia bacterium]
MVQKRVILGESGGPTPVIDWEVAGAVAQAQKRGWEVYGMINGLEGLLNANIEGNIVDLTDVDPMSFAFNGPGACLRTTRLKPGAEQYEKMGRNLDELDVDAVIYFGGNDSADQLHGLSQKADVQTIHGIKTVDNDLPVTHHCPGYGSAALYNATALKNVHSDYSSYRVRANFEIDNKIQQAWDTAPVAIYQVMGRKAGWLAQGTGFAKVDPKGQILKDRPPHLILSREIPFDKEEFMGHLDDILTRLGEAVIVVQEDLTEADTGKSLAEKYADDVARDEHGNIQHGRATSFSPAVFLAQLCTEELEVETVHGKVKDVALVPQHIQRSCMMSSIDASEAYMVGSSCINALDDGESGKSVVFRRDNGQTETDLTEMSNIAAKERDVERKYINDVWGPTQEFIDEFIYLIGGPAALPHYSMRRFPSVAVPQGIADNPYVKNE